MPAVDRSLESLPAWTVHIASRGVQRRMDEQMSKKTTLLVAALCGMFALGSVGQVAWGGKWVVQQITDNLVDDGPPLVYGSTVAWSQWMPDPVGTSQWDVFSYDGVSTTRLTSNYVQDVDAAPDESGVFWRAWDGSDVEIYFHDGTSKTALTDTAYSEGAPPFLNAPKSIRTSGLNAVWGAPIGNDWQVVLYEGATGTITQVSNANSGDWNNYAEPRIDGTRVVWNDWEGDLNGDEEIFYYDGTSTTQLTDNDTHDQLPRISGTNVVWQGGVGDTDIFLYDGATITQLSNSPSEDVKPEISGSNVTWVAWDDNDWEIFFYDGSTITQLTDNDVNDVEAHISGSTVIWQTWDANFTSNEIFLYDGSAVTQLTDDAGIVYYDNLEVHGSTLVFNGFDGFFKEVFVARLAGDTDVDGDVDFDDFLALQLAWQSGSGWANGDFDGDGDVDGDDFTVLHQWYNGGGGVGGTTVPEPASILLLAVAGLIPLRIRRTRLRGT